MLNRREFTNNLIAAGVACVPAAHLLRQPVQAAETNTFRLNYMLASAMYGKMPLADILPEVKKTGAEYIEIWAERHGNQREQIDQMGAEAFLDLLKQNDVKLGSLTCFKYGIFNMQDEMKLVKQLGGDMVICNTPKPAKGLPLKDAVQAFAKQLQPHLEVAESLGITIGVENHGGGVIASPESILQLMEELPSKHLGLAMAPYHLPQVEATISQLIRDLGDRLVHFQAWEHGDGCMTKLPKEQELLQLPHRGPLDWKPLLMALKQSNYTGRTEIFMHPTPRGIPILDTKEEVTAEINACRRHLDELIAVID